jgi:hypothetical protein
MSGLVAAIRKADPSLSLRRIGKLIGVSQVTVLNDLTAEAENERDISEAVLNDLTDDGLAAAEAAA